MTTEYLTIAALGGIILCAIAWCNFARDIICRKNKPKLQESEESRLKRELHRIGYSKCTADGKALCRIRRSFDDVTEANDEYNRIMEILERLHVEIYEDGTYVRMPKNASDELIKMMISWYRDGV